MRSGRWHRVAGVKRSISCVTVADCSSGEAMVLPLRRTLCAEAGNAIAKAMAAETRISVLRFVFINRSKAYPNRSVPKSRVVGRLRSDC